MRKLSENGFVVSPCFVFAVKSSGIDDEKLEKLIETIMKESSDNSEFSNIANGELFESLQS